MQIHLQPSKCKNYQSHFAVVYAKGLQWDAMNGLQKIEREKSQKNILRVLMCLLKIFLNPHPPNLTNITILC